MDAEMATAMLMESNVREAKTTLEAVIAAKSWKELKQTFRVVKSLATPPLRHVMWRAMGVAYPASAAEFAGPSRSNSSSLNLGDTDQDELVEEIVMTVVSHGDLIPFKQEEIL
jgi:hypothetical protein